MFWLDLEREARADFLLFPGISDAQTKCTVRFKERQSTDLNKIAFLRGQLHLVVSKIAHYLCRLCAKICTFICRKLHVFVSIFRRSHTLLFNCFYGLFWCVKSHSVRKIARFRVEYCRFLCRKLHIFVSILGTFWAGFWKVVGRGRTLIFSCF